MQPLMAKCLVQAAFIKHLFVMRNYNGCHPIADKIGNRSGFRHKSIYAYKRANPSIGITLVAVRVDANIIKPLPVTPAAPLEVTIKIPMMVMI